MIRSDSAGGSSRLAWHLRDHELRFTLGMQIDQHVREAILAQPEHAWTPAVDPDGQARPGAEVCELTGWIDLDNWPPGTRASASQLQDRSPAVLPPGYARSAARERYLRANCRPRSQPTNLSLAGSRPMPRRRAVPSAGPVHQQQAGPTPNPITAVMLTVVSSP